MSTDSKPSKRKARLPWLVSLVIRRVRSWLDTPLSARQHSQHRTSAAAPVWHSPSEQNQDCAKQIKSGVATKR